MLSQRVSVVLVGAALVASSCAGGGELDDTARWASEDDVPALFGVRRNISDGARRVDTTIDPGELEPPPPPLPTIGDLTIPCGPSTEALSDGDTPGLTADSINIGTGNDRGGLYSATFGRGIPDTIRVLADRCNALGGINGRVVEVTEHDAAVLEIVEQMQTACEADFALVGHGYLLDTIADSVRSECGLPSFPAWTTMRPGAETLTVAAVPSQPDHLVLDGLILAVDATGEAGDPVGIVVPATEGGRDAASRVQAALTGAGAGIDTVAYEYSVDRETDWDAIASSASSAGVAVVWVEGSCGSTLVPLMEAATAREWRPTIVGGPALYDPYCASLHSTLIEGTLVGMQLHPAEDSAEVAAVDEHVRLLRAAGIAPTGDALRAASAFWLWASAVSDCAEPLTRDCVVTTASSIEEWTAGGLHPATDPGTWTDSGCFVIISVVDGSFERLADAQPGEMNCAPELRIEIG